jgi:hypothetical protein
VLTFGQFKTAIRQIVWSTGEAPNHVVPHDKWFIDALIDLQASVLCLQQDNTDIVPQCATLFKCGLTVLDAPRGGIHRVSVVDRLAADATESAEADVDWCSELEYVQVEPCCLRQWLSLNARNNLGSCFSWYWGLAPLLCGWDRAPEPTDEGVDATLPALPLGHHYPQTSTDKPNRARSGRWMLERGKIYIYPSIQSTESVLIMWDGIKRTWSDTDPIDEDPLLASAVEEWMRWKHAERYDRDLTIAQTAEAAYARGRSELIHQCREETRVRGCEPSYARSANVTALFFNDTAGHATAICPSGQTGDPVSVTIAVGTVSSSVSVADANLKANDAAKAQADAQLVCVPVTPQVPNDEKSATAYCAAAADAPPPDGDPQTVIIPAGTYFADTKDLANQLAQAAANEQAAAKLVGTCTWWNREVSYTASCPDDPSITDTRVIPMHTLSSQISQADADWLALNDPLSGAIAMAQSHLVCPAGGPFGNTLLDMPPRATNCTVPGGPTGSHSCTVFIRVRVHADTVSRPTLQQANQDALSLATQLGIAYGLNLCSPTYCGRTFYIMVDSTGIHGPSLTPIP